MAELTLLRRGSELAAPAAQVRFLEAADHLPTFSQSLDDQRHWPLRSHNIAVLQVNLGKLCNQTCAHCHVDAGPDRRESMSEAVAQACLRLLAATDIPTLDVTGGAPEMNRQFRPLVEGARRLGRRVIDRCNLTILVAPGYEDLPQFLADESVEIIASLPCYLEANVDKQRGDRVFQRSLAALRRLNELGYGLPDSPLSLTLVYNPVGASLPPDQQRLEADYRRELSARYGIEFTRLFTITNMPISRYLADLVDSGRFDEYMHQLVNAFNPATLDGLMCRSTLSVDWQGQLADCDFNQMLGLGLSGRLPRNILEVDFDNLSDLFRREIVVGRHCFGCTAGAGSSCGGSLAGDTP